VSSSTNRTTSEILRAMSVIGTSHAVAAFTRVLRMKVFALCLGPAGIGLAGIYYALLNTLGALSAFGIGSSGVRQVAQTAGDERRSAQVVFTVRLLTLALGVSGALAVLLLRRPLSEWAFGNYEQLTAVAVLGVGVLFSVLNDSHMAILAGLRRLRALAHVNVTGTLFGTLAAVALVWYVGEPGLVYAVVASPLIMAGCSWWFARPALSTPRRPSWPEFSTEARSLLRLGFALMLTTFMMGGALLVTRVLYVEHLGLPAAGYFHAAWALAILPIEFVFNVLSVDYYPDLTARMKNDVSAAHALVNQETEVALLVGGPPVLATLAFSDVVLRIFYSAEFALAAPLLGWLLLGALVRIISWPLGYVIVAQGWAPTLFVVEFVWTASYLVFVYLACPYLGLTSAGYAWVAAYFIYVATLYAIARSRIGFAWTTATVRLAAIVLTIGIALLALSFIDGVLRYTAAALLLSIVSCAAFRRLCEMVDNPSANRIARAIRQKAPFARIA
jgi:antigen flippase